MHFKELEEGDVLFDIGDEPTQYYMVVTGSVVIQQKNPLIKNWDWAKKVNNALIEWKTKVFDKKVESAMQVHMFK